MKYKEINGKLYAKECLLDLIYKLKAENIRRLPSERSLAAMFKTGRTSLRAAIKELCMEDIIYTVPNGGSYIRANKIFRNIIGVNNFSKSIRETGAKMQTKLLSLNLVPASKKVASKLGISIDDSVYKLVRLRSFNKTPAFIETLFINENMVPNLINIYSEKDSLTYIYNNIYKISLSGGLEKISFSYPSSEECLYLEINHNLPLFYCSGITYTKSNKAFEYYKILFRSDMFSFNYLLEED